MIRSLLLGTAAGAVGTVALNTATYLDMLARGRGASSMPARTAEKLVGSAHVSLGEGDAEQNRQEAVGALLGIASGLGVGLAYGAVRSGVDVPWPLAAVGLAVAANVGTTGPMTAMGLTDPRTWPGSSWVSDLVPHGAYGLAAAAAYELFTPRRLARR